MMRDLEHRRPEPIRTGAGEKLPLSPATEISGQKQRSARGDRPQDQRTVVAVTLSRRWRVQDLEPPHAQRRLAAVPQRPPAQAGPRPERLETVRRRETGCRPDLANRKIRGQLDQATAVVQIRMADHHRVEAPHASSRERRHQHPLGDVPSMPPTSVHQEGAGAVPYQDRLALADIQHHHLDARPGTRSVEQEQGGGQTGAPLPPRAGQQRRGKAQGDGGGADPTATINLDSRWAG